MALTSLLIQQLHPLITLTWLHMRQALAGHGAVAETAPTMLFDDDLDMPAPAAAMPGGCTMFFQAFAMPLLITAPGCTCASSNMLRNAATVLNSDAGHGLRERRPATAGGGAAPRLATGCRMGCVRALAALAPAQPDVAVDTLGGMLGAALEADVAPPEGLVHMLAEALCTAACASGCCSSAEPAHNPFSSKRHCAGMQHRCVCIHTLHACMAWHAPRATSLCVCAHASMNHRLPKPCGLNRGMRALVGWQAGSRST